MIYWRIIHREETISTNVDARAGVPGDVFTADYQSEGRGRLDHKWISPRGANLLMSVVLDVRDMEPGEVATLPLAVGLAVAMAARRFVVAAEPVQIKWPNDVLVGGRKVAGILCELDGNRVIVGIGVNVKKQEFSIEIADRATTLGVDSVEVVRDAVLEGLAAVYGCWSVGGFASLHEEISAIDALKGKRIGVKQIDGDPKPIEGLCGGILADGSLDIDGQRIYAGEATIC